MPNHYARTQEDSLAFFFFNEKLAASTLLAVGSAGWEALVSLVTGFSRLKGRQQHHNPPCPSGLPAEDEAGGFSTALYPLLPHLYPIFSPLLLCPLMPVLECVRVYLGPQGLGLPQGPTYC
jgi:hypothetical protein